MTATRKTDEQIAQEIKKLNELKPRVPSNSMFGDDNHAAIDAQIAVLTERMGMDAIYSRFDNEDDPEEDRSALDSAIEAHDWITGERADDEDSPSEGWAILAK